MALNASVVLKKDQKHSPTCQLLTCPPSPALTELSAPPGSVLVTAAATSRAAPILPTELPQSSQFVQRAADMLMVMVLVLNYVPMTKLLTELHIFYYEIKAEVEERKAWGQEVK